MDRVRRSRESRFRSPPRRGRNGGREDARGGGLGSVTLESERLEDIVGLGYDGYRDEQLEKLLLFNESLLSKDSPSLKFQWNRLLEEKSSYASVNVGSSYGASNGGDDERGYPGRSRFADFGVENQRSGIGATKGYGHIDSNSNSRYVNPCLEKKEEIQFQDYSVHREEEKSSACVGNVPRHMIPSPEPKFYTTDEMVLTPNQHTGHDGYEQPQMFNSHRNSEMRLRDLTDRRPVQPTPLDDLDGVFVYSGVQHGERNNVGTLCDDVIFETNASKMKDHELLNLLRRRVVEPVVDRMDDIEGSPDGTGEQHDYLHSLQKEYLGECIGRDDEVIGSRSTHREYETEVHIDHDSMQFEEDYGSEKDITLLMQEVEVGLYGTESSSQHRFMTEDRRIHVSSGNIHKGKCSIVKKLSRHKSKRKLYYNWDASSNLRFMSNGDEHKAAKDIGNAYYENQLHRSNQSLSMQIRSSRLVRSLVRDLRKRLGPLGPTRHSSKHEQSGSRDLKKRLGPARHSNKHVQSSSRDVKNRLGPLGPARHSNKHVQSGSRDVKKRLGPLEPALPVSYPQIGKKNQESHENLGDSDKVLHAERGDSSEANPKCTKTHEPAEDSEEFKHLVHSTFLKFVKLLNENPTQRRKYLDLKGDCTLKCSVCGSDSEEFMDTISLVIHTFMFRSAGSRVEHLGFHKALCLLMEWNSAVDPNCSWVQLVLPYAEASALKDDLIIWPPVVIVLNSSTASNNLDDLKTVSPQELEDDLKGKGFGVGKTKVCRGKPSNHGILVVTFQGTFSGLQEAERLHKYYEENKQGRSEFEHIIGNRMSEETQNLPTDERESPLYGYLGIAEDLDKLDFGTKKRSVVKSKKEIRAIVDASSIR